MQLNWQLVHGEGVETYEAKVSGGAYRVFGDEDSAFGAVFVEFATDENHFCTVHATQIARIYDWEDAKIRAEMHYAGLTQ